MSVAPRFRIPALFLALAALMTATRFSHFGPLPDASWAVFFAAGFYLTAQWRWAFPALMAIAVAVDWAVIAGSGQSFWSHYCVSPGYWFLLPAHAAMWLGGSLLSRLEARRPLLALAALAPALLASVVLCHLFAQGGFYWLSSSVAEPTVAGWWKNYSDWLPAYAATCAAYVGAIALLHAVVQLASARGGDAAVTQR